MIKFETLNVNNPLSDKLLSNLVSYLKKNVKDFPSLDDKTIGYSYEPEYRIVALWWDMGSGYECSDEFTDLEEFESYVLDYDTEDRIKGIEIFEFFPEKFEGD